MTEEVRASLPTRLSPEQRQAIVKKYGKNFGKALLKLPGPSSLGANQMMTYAQKLRDKDVWQIPILPGAITVYQQLASGREWKVSGSIRGASRAVEFLNNARTVSSNGLLNIGFEDYLKRRALDWLIVGRTAFLNQGRASSPLEYLDPTELLFTRETNNNEIAKPSEKTWQYQGMENTRYMAKEVFLNHPIPIGSDFFISPIAALLPTAMLAWLIREHDSASLDGRKIRDVILVGTDNVADAIEEAIISSVALYSGANPSEVGVPVVAINNMTGQPIKDQVHLLGLSRLPEQFDRNQFVFDYVNQISAALGLTLRHFWNSEMTTNKALEEVQEQRQQNKGPASFVRSEQRLINSSQILKRFGRNVRFGFVEEVDSASQKVNAEVLKLTAEAVATIAKVFGASINPEGYLAWMQQLGTMPSELEIITTTAKNPVVVDNPDEPPLPDEENQPVDGNPDPSPLEGVDNRGKTELQYDEVVIDQYGRVIERRNKVYSIFNLLLSGAEPKGGDVYDEDAEYERALQEARQESLNTFKQYIGEHESDLLTTWSEGQSIYLQSEVQALVTRVRTDVSLTADDYAMMEFILDDVALEQIA